MNLFESCDRLPKEQGYKAAIEASGQVVDYIYCLAKEAATETSSGDGTAVGRLVGSLAQMWKSPELAKIGVPQKPSSLGQMLVLGGLGSLLGYGAGRLIDPIVPYDVGKASRVGALLGGMLGLVPGASSAVLNHYQGKSPFFDSFYSTKEGSFYNQSPFLPINVHDFQRTIWTDPHLRAIPLDVRACASGLVQGAANRPDRRGNTAFVTPIDVTRMAVGMGSGLASGWLVGKTMGTLFGTGPKTQDFLRKSGIAAGALRTIIPVAYGQEPFAVR